MCWETSDRWLHTVEHVHSTVATPDTGPLPTTVSVLSDCVTCGHKWRGCHCGRRGKSKMFTWIPRSTMNYYFLNVFYIHLQINRVSAVKTSFDKLSSSLQSYLFKSEHSAIYFHAIFNSLHKIICYKYIKSFNLSFIVLQQAEEILQTLRMNMAYHVWKLNPLNVFSCRNTC